MKGLLPLKDGESQDAHSRYSRSIHFWKRGQLKKVKRRTSKRERAHGRRIVRGLEADRGD